MRPLEWALIQYDLVLTGVNLDTEHRQGQDGGHVMAIYNQGERRQKKPILPIS